MQKIKQSEQQTQVERLINEVHKAEPKFSNIEFKRLNISITLNSKNYHNSTANCKIIADSVIHISIQPFFGIEMFIVRLTPDRLTVIDKIKSVCYQTDYNLLKQQLGLNINYQIFEALFTNKLFTIENNDSSDTDEINAFETDGHKILTYKNSQLNRQFTLNKNHRIKTVSIRTNNENEEFSVVYDDFINTKSFDFPSGIHFLLKSKAQSFGFSFLINQFNVDDKINIPELDTQKYQPGNINLLFKSVL